MDDVVSNRRSTKLIYSAPNSQRPGLARGMRLREAVLARLEFWIMFFPEGFIGRFLRRKYWRWRFRIETDPDVQFGAKIVGEGFVEIGGNFLLGFYSEVNAGSDGIGRIYIGRDVGIARGCMIVSVNHRYDRSDIPIMSQGHVAKSVEHKGVIYGIVIEDDVWIGANVVVVSGAHIGTGSVIGANSLVIGVIPPFSIVMGNPGRVVKSRLDSPSKRATETGR